MEKFKAQNLRNLKNAALLAWKSAPALTLANSILSVAQGILPLLTLVLTKRLVDAVVLALSSPVPQRSAGMALFFISCMAAVSLTQAILRSLAQLANEAQSQAVSDHVSEILHAKSIEVDLEYYENPRYYDTLHRAQREASFRAVNIVTGLASLFTNIFTLLAVAALIVSFHWAFAALLLVAVIPGALMRLKHSDRLYQWHRRRTQAERRTYYLSWLMTSAAYAKEIRLFKLGPMFARRFAELRRKLRAERIRITAARSLAEAVSGLAATAAVFGPLAFIAYRCIRGAITLGGMVMYYQAFQRCLSSLNNLKEAIANFYDNSLFISDFYEFLNLKKQVAEPERPRPFPEPLGHGVSFEHISFYYPGSSRRVIEDVSFSVRPGEHVALVGDNGAGKTTLIKLLCRLYDPSSGRITVDGIDLKEFDTGVLRNHISAVFQDYAQYFTTARENIWFGDIAADPNGEEVEKAARSSGADGVIRALSGGYETVLGKLFEEGQELSIGEWQKLALARAFLRDSQILILDEPTSNLDVRTEFEVFRRFHELAKGRTVFFISHRLSTVRMADRIFILRDGRIVESGSHQELVRAGGVYAGLFHMQAERYR